MNQDQRVIDVFTEMAPRYEETIERELRQFWGVGYEAFIGQALARLDVGRSHAVLDVATGRGAIPLALARRPDWSGRVVGLDITPGMLRGARGRASEAGERLALACGSGMQLPFATGSFDAVICALATHHMNVRVLLGEAHRVLRRGGQLLVADVAPAPFWYSPAGRVVFDGLARWYARREGEARVAAEIDALSNMQTPDQWRAILVRAGFGIASLVDIPARRRWYPRGVLIHAYSQAEAVSV